MRDNIEWQYVEGETGEEIVNCVEKILDIQFPAEYIECVKKYPHGHPSPNFFKTDKQTWGYGDGGGGSFEFFINFDPESKGFILKKYHAINYHSGGDNKVPDGIIPFALGFNNHDNLCFDYRQGFPPKIVLFDLHFHWDYLDYLEDPVNCKEVKEEDYLIHVCNSFSELLNMLEEEPKNT